MSDDQFETFKTGKYAGCAIGYQWRRMDEGRVLWWYSTARTKHPTRDVPKDIEEVASKFRELGGFADLTLCEFIVSMFQETPDDQVKSFNPSRRRGRQKL